jgi:threonine dehydrogenase-like Zn-dependent dehydrogenase
MRALVFDGPHRLRVEERPLPEPGPGEVRIRLAAVGICGSDLHGYTGETGRRQPGMVMGHEASGWVDALGPQVVGRTLGEAVTFIPTLPCPGECGHATANTCARLQVIGVTPTIQGAFADSIVVPADRVVPVGSLPPEVAAAAEPFAVAMHAVARTGVQPGDAVLVTGGGMIGLCCAVAASLAGAGTVYVSDPLADRRALAAGLGAQGIEPAQVDALGQLDRAIDAVGISQTAAAALTAVPPGGTVCFVGLGLPEIALPLFEVVARERTVVGSFAYPDTTFRQAVEHLRTGAVDLSPLLGRTVALAQAPAAFAGLADGSIADAKVTVLTGQQPPQGGAP